MRRSSLKFAAVSLLSVSLAACGSLGLSSDDKSATASKTSSDAGADLAALKDHSANLADAVQHAQSLRAQGNYADAVHVLSQLMLIAPDDPRVVAEYGKVLVQQNRASEATDFLKRAVELQPGDWTLYSALGVAYDQLGDTESAKFAYERALQLSPGEATVLNNFAMSRAQAGDIVSARRLIAEAAAKNAADPKIAKNVALIATYTPSQAAPRAEKPALAEARTPSARQATAAAPRSLASGNVVMQSVPTDPMAGPVGKAKVSHHHAPASPDKAAEPTAIAKGKTPELRASADAS
jgi:Flp pilus assembly protein TadD